MNGNEDDKKNVASSSSAGGETSAGPNEAHVTTHKGVAERMEYDYMLEKQTHGVEKYSKLGWVQLVVVLIVEAIALGSLSIPS